MKINPKKSQKNALMFPKKGKTGGQRVREGRGGIDNLREGTKATIGEDKFEGEKIDIIFHISIILEKFPILYFNFLWRYAILMTTKINSSELRTKKRPNFAAEILRKNDQVFALPKFVLHSFVR